MNIHNNMGKYWYKDHDDKWRMGDDNDDAIVGLLILLATAAIWIIWKPISWWLLKKNEPTTGEIVLWVIAIFAILFLVIYFNNN